MFTRLNGPFNPTKEKRYLFNLKSYFKIWLSPKPEVFLGIENELRFIRMREQNKTSTLHFIYSEQCLNEETINALQAFCNRFNLIPVAFESWKELLDEEDKKIFDLAALEISRYLNQSGGNLAAAADCLRALVYPMKTYGIYLDFDVESSLEQLQAEFVSLRCPLLFSTEILSTIYEHEVSMQPNSDFFALGLDEKTEAPAKEGITALRFLQNRIVHNYQNPFNWEILSPSARIDKLNNYPEIPELMEQFHAQYPKNPTVFDFRCFLHTLPTVDKGKLEPVNLFLERLSVINISGPGVFYYLYQHLIPKTETIVPLTIPKIAAWLPYLKLYERSGIGFYEQINACVNGNNAIFKSMVSALFNGKQKVNDNSWTQKGLLEKESREQEIAEAAQVIQKAIRRQSFWRKDCVHLSIYLKIQEICTHASILTSIKEQKYAQALRRACSGLVVPVIKLLIQYKTQRGLDFDVNEIASGSTAMDWLLKYSPKNNVQRRVKEEMIALLHTVDALTAQECTRNSLTTLS